MNEILKKLFHPILRQSDWVFFQDIGLGLAFKRPIKVISYLRKNGFSFLARARLRLKLTRRQQRSSDEALLDRKTVILKTEKAQNKILVSMYFVGK